MPGWAILKAVKNVNDAISPKLNRMVVKKQRDIDATLAELEWKSNKSKLGENANVAVSLALAKANVKAFEMRALRHI